MELFEAPRRKRKLSRYIKEHIIQHNETRTTDALENVLRCSDRWCQ